MNTSENPSTEKLDEGFTRTWRYKTGLFMIILGQTGILVSMTLPLLGVGTGIVGAVFITAEIMTLSSIVFLGKEGFKAIKAKAFAFVKSTYTGPVSRKRFYFGLMFLFTNIVTTYIMIVFAWVAFASASPELPPPDVWGLDFDQQADLLYWLFLVGEITFLISIYVLGADWWGRFRRIFVWQG